MSEWTYNETNEDEYVRGGNELRCGFYNLLAQIFTSVEAVHGLIGCTSPCFITRLFEIRSLFDTNITPPNHSYKPSLPLGGQRQTPLRPPPAINKGGSTITYTQRLI